VFLLLSKKSFISICSCSFNFCFTSPYVAFSALMQLVGSRNNIQPIKNWSGEVLAWLFVWSEVQMTCNAYGQADATATPSSLLQTNPEWLSFWQWHTYP